MEIKLTKRQLEIITTINTEKTKLKEEYSKIEQREREIIDVLLDAKEIDRKDIAGLSLEGDFIKIQTKPSVDTYLKEIEIPSELPNTKSRS